MELVGGGSGVLVVAGGGGHRRNGPLNLVQGHWLQQWHSAFAVNKDNKAAVALNVFRFGLLYICTFLSNSNIAACLHAHRSCLVDDTFLGMSISLKQQILFGYFIFLFIYFLDPITNILSYMVLPGFKLRFTALVQLQWHWSVYRLILGKQFRPSSHIMV